MHVIVHECHASYWSFPDTSMQQITYTHNRECYAPINVSPHPPPLLGEVGQSWGFDLIRIQLPHPLGNVRSQILTGHALRVFRMRTLAIQYPNPWGKPAIPNKENSPPCPGWGGGLTLIDRRIMLTTVVVRLCRHRVHFPSHWTDK